MRHDIGGEARNKLYWLIAKMTVLALKLIASPGENIKATDKRVGTGTLTEIVQVHSGVATPISETQPAQLRTSKLKQIIPL